MKNIILTIFLSLVGCLTACKNTEKKDSNNPNAVNLYSEKSKLITSVKEKKLVSAIKQTIQQRKVSHEKILPIYKHHIELIIDGEKQVWLISSLGYIKRKDNNSNQMYKISNPEIFTKYLKE